MAIAAQLCPLWGPGTVVKLEGDLGAGKTTFVRGVLRHLGYQEAVKSPTFSLLCVYDTNPPVAHLDLYRLRSYEGVGLEDLLDTHVCLIEWPDRAVGLVLDPAQQWTIKMQGEDSFREIIVETVGTELD